MAIWSPMVGAGAAVEATGAVVTCGAAAAAPAIGLNVATERAIAQPMSFILAPNFGLLDRSTMNGRTLGIGGLIGAGCLALKGG